MNNHIAPELPSELLQIPHTPETQRFITSKEKHQIKKANKAARKQPVTLTIYALPLFRDREVLLLSPDPSHTPPGTLRHKVAENWRTYDISTAGKSQAKSYEWGVRKMEGISATTRLLANVPKRIGEITVVHGSSEFHETLYRELSTISKASRFKYTGKSILWALALPFIALVDALALGWPKAATTVDVVFVCKNANASKGATRLRRALSSPSRIVDFSGLDNLDIWRERVRQKEEGVLSDREIMELCSEIDKPDLAMPMMELRRTYLRSIGRSDLIEPDLGMPLQPPVFVAQ